MNSGKAKEIDAILYVNAGKKLGKVDSLGAIFSPRLLFSFAHLGVASHHDKETDRTLPKQTVAIGDSSPGLNAVYKKTQ